MEVTMASLSVVEWCSIKEKTAEEMGLECRSGGLRSVVGEDSYGRQKAEEGRRETPVVKRIR